MHLSNQFISRLNENNKVVTVKHCIKQKLSG